MTKVPSRRLLQDEAPPETGAGGSAERRLLAQHETITNPRTRKPVDPMTLARVFAAELEFECSILAGGLWVGSLGKWKILTQQGPGGTPTYT
jgi:hypothetical protein